MENEKLKDFKENAIKAIKREENAGIVVTSTELGAAGTKSELVMMFGRLAEKLYKNGIEREILKEIVEGMTLNEQELKEKIDKAIKDFCDILKTL